MLRIRQIDHIVLRVVDLEAMLKFYVEILGCAPEKNQEEVGLYQVRAGSSLIDFVPVDGKLGRMGGAPPGPEGRNLDHLCLRLDPFDPAQVMKETEGPVLVIQGDLDKQVFPHHADKLGELARGRKGKQEVEVVHLPGVNHLLVPAKTGEVSEYGSLESKTISPEVARRIAAFLKRNP